MKNSSKAKILAIIGTAENSSEHPLGQAVVRYAKSILNKDMLGQCSHFNAVPGRGLKAIVSNTEDLSKIQLNDQHDDVYVQENDISNIDLGIEFLKFILKESNN